MPGPVHKICLISYLVLALVLCGLNAVFAKSGHTGAGDTAVEYKVKAAFLLNFAKFIHWPRQIFTGDNEPFTMCVLGPDPFGDALASLLSRNVSGHPITLDYPDTATEAAKCQMIFIAQPETINIKRLDKDLAGLPVVMVSDAPGFADQNGIIEFINRNGRLSFRINLAEAKKRNVGFSAALLNLAAEVIQ